MEERRETNPRVNFLINIAYWAVIVAIIFLVFKYLINIMMPIFLAFIFAAVVRPISRALSRETRYVRGKDGNKVLVKRKFHMNRNVAGIISVLVLFIVVGGLLTLIVVRLTDTIVDFVSFAPTFYEQSVLPGITKLYNWVLEVGERFDVSIMDAIEQALPGMISNLGSTVTNLSGKIVSGITGIASRLPSILLNSIICLIATVFISVDFDRIRLFIRKNLPEKPLRVAVNVKNSFLEMIWQFIKSYAIIFCITVAEITVGLLIVGVGNPLLFGILIGIFDALPIVGSGMILLPWSIITLLTGNTMRGLGILIIYAVVVIARQIIEPKIVGKHVGLRPIVTLTCMYAGSKLFGGLIGLFGLPITAAIIMDLNSSGIFHIFNSVGDDLNDGDETGAGEVKQAKPGRTNPERTERKTHDDQYFSHWRCCRADRPRLSQGAFKAAPEAQGRFLHRCERGKRQRCRHHARAGGRHSRRRSGRCDARQPHMDTLGTAAVSRREGAHPAPGQLRPAVPRPGRCDVYNAVRPHPRHQSSGAVFSRYEHR